MRRFMITLKQLESHKDRESRHTYVSDRIRELLAAQIRAMREEHGWSQAELGEEAGMAQERVSLLEDPDYSGVTLKTLRRLGKAFDVALLVEYVPFRELVERIQAGKKLTVPSYDTDLAEQEKTWYASQATVGMATAIGTTLISGSAEGLFTLDNWLDPRETPWTIVETIGGQFVPHRGIPQSFPEIPSKPQYALAS